MRHYASHGGVGILVILLVAFLALSYFNVDLEAVFKKPEVSQGLQTIQDQTTTLYNTELKQHVEKFWNEVVVAVIWKNFIENMKSGGTQMIQNSIDQMSQPTQTPPQSTQ